MVDSVLSRLKFGVSCHKTEHIGGMSLQMLKEATELAQ